MKRTLAISMWLAMSVAALAQTPTVVEKPAQKAATDKNKTVAVNSKPSPATTAKVVPAAQTTAKVTAKPAVVPVQSATAKAAAPAVKPVAVTAKSNTPAPAKAVAVPVAKTNPAPAKVAPAVAKTSTVPVVKANAAPAVKTVSAATPKAAMPVVDAHKATVAVNSKAAGSNVKAVPPAAKTQVKTIEAGKQKDPFSGKKAVAAAKPAPQSAVPVKDSKPVGTTVAVKDNKPVEEEKKPEPKKVSMTSRRDPFISPIVKMGAVGSGCNSGKRCLAIEQIAVRGVVHSENGMIAVVVNAMDKAYFLRENDPVFNGYVLKITGDSVVFKQTFRDRLGKPMTRDITKTISRPAA
jgi:hypothetical protein